MILKHIENLITKALVFSYRERSYRQATKWIYNLTLTTKFAALLLHAHIHRSLKIGGATLQYFYAACHRTFWLGWIGPALEPVRWYATGTNQVLIVLRTLKYICQIYVSKVLSAHQCGLGHYGPQAIDFYKVVLELNQWHLSILCNKYFCPISWNQNCLKTDRTWIFMNF